MKNVDSFDSTKGIMSDNVNNQEVTKYVLRNKSISKSQRELKYLYTNADQLLNKIDDLKVTGCHEVMPKSQKNPIFNIQLDIEGYELYKNI